MICAISKQNNFIINSLTLLQLMERLYNQHNMFKSSLSHKKQSSRLCLLETVQSRVVQASQ